MNSIPGNTPMSNEPLATGTSFNYYPGLDDELERAFERNKKQGNATPETIAVGGLEVATQNALRKLGSHNMVKAEELLWISDELAYARSRWQRYEHVLPDECKLDSLQDPWNPNLTEARRRLYSAKEALDASDETTPDGEPIGEAMHLVAVPWRFFRDSLDNLPAALQSFRAMQELTPRDSISASIRRDINDSNATMYKMWDRRTMYSAREYLDRKVEQDGPWGIMLAQTSDRAGVASWIAKSPDELTAKGTKPLKLESHSVDGMGIFEWLALTLQEDPKYISSQDESWLLANRVNVNRPGRMFQVPYGDSLVGVIGITLALPTIRGENARPRLAVL